MRWVWRAASIGLLTLGVHGCPKAAPPGAPPGATGDFDERQVCTADADCAVVEIGCCDRCNGGTAAGVHRDHAEEVRLEYTGGTRCAAARCAKSPCADVARAICRSQRCGVEVGGVEQVMPLPPP
jgi:hypothetical protein